MGVITRSATDQSGWSVQTSDGTAHLILSEAELVTAELPVGELEGVSVAVHPLEPGQPIPPEVTQSAHILVVEVRCDQDASLRRLACLRADHPHLAIIAAIRSPTVALVKQLLHSGVDDVVALPLATAELTQSLAQLRAKIDAARGSGPRGRIISVIGSVGGVGSTMLVTQAANLRAFGRAGAPEQTCLFDLDVQFGSAASYLGLTPKLSLTDLLEAGSRVDGALLRAAMTETPDGLHVVAAPTDIVPMDCVDPDQIYRLVDLASREFETVFLDLPNVWSNWSLSLIARSDTVLLVVEMTIASLRHARRQLALLAAEGIASDRIIIVANRIQKRLFRTIDLKDAAQALGHPVDHRITDDEALVGAALNQGVSLRSLKPGSAVEKEIQSILAACEARVEQGA